MDQPQQQRAQNPPPPQTTTTTTTSHPTEPPSQTTSQQPLQPPQQQQQPEQTLTPTPPSPSTTTAIPTTNTPNPNPSPIAKPTSLTPPQPRPTSFFRPWQQPHRHSHFSHFSSIPSSSESPSSSVSSPISAPPRGGIAIGVPASRSNAASPQTAPPLSASFGQQFGGLGRGGVNVPDSASTSSLLQVRSPGMQGIAVMGSLGSSSQMRPGGISVQHHQQRPVQQSSLRQPPSSPNSQSPATPNFQGQGLMRVSPVGSTGSSSPNTSQSVQSFNQPWLSSGSQGKPPLPPLSMYRPQMNTLSMQQRSHIPQQHSPLSTTSQQQHVSSVQSQQSKRSHQLQEHYGQQFSYIHRASSHLNYIDPSERLDSEVEYILLDIAEDFVESHRKSDTLDAKDILLHLERNWNMTLPGFSGDEIKTYKKPLANDIHRERLVVIKKSVMATEVASTRIAGQGAANVKGNMGKAPANIIGST